MKYIKCAAEGGSLFAQNSWGYQHEMGQIVKQDMKIAFKYYKISADQNNSLAQKNLACLYLKYPMVMNKEEPAIDYSIVLGLFVRAMTNQMLPLSEGEKREAKLELEKLITFLNVEEDPRSLKT